LIQTFHEKYDAQLTEFKESLIGLKNSLEKTDEKVDSKIKALKDDLQVQFNDLESKIKKSIENLEPKIV
jgi:chaperonin cofactor prefoldin